MYYNSLFPVRDLVALTNKFEKLANQVIKNEDENVTVEWIPAAEIIEETNAYHINLDLPGVKKEDLKLEFKDGKLFVSGERKQPVKSETAKYFRAERNYGKYTRVFRMPKSVQIDKISAELKDGELFITIPKSEESLPRTFEISVN